MTDPHSNQEMFLSAIRALAENPDALKLLIENEPLNTAIARYIEASAEAVAVKSDWREVWRQESAPRTFHIKPSTWDKTEREIPVCADMRVYYNESRRVALLEAYIRPSGMDIYTPYITPGDFFLERTAQIVKDYSAAVEWGQSLWATVVEIFERDTTPLSDGGVS